MEYNILSSHESPDELVTLVQDALKDGWTPAGGVAVAAPMIDEVPAPLYLQALVRD